MVRDLPDNLILETAKRIFADEFLILRCTKLQAHAPRGLGATQIQKSYQSEKYGVLQLLAAIHAGRLIRQNDGSGSPNAKETR